MPAPKNIGVRGIAIGMLRLGANQETVVARIGVHKTTISRWWMRYQRDPSKVPEPKKSTGRKGKVTLRNLLRIKRFLDLDLLMVEASSTRERRKLSSTKFYELSK